jgi:hypothetical protein
MYVDVNVQRWEYRINADGDRVRVAIPFECGCGEPACYGREGVWYCTACWQRYCAEEVR